MPKADFRFHTSLRVRWMECDAQGIVFNGAYMDYLEVGQSEPTFPRSNHLSWI